MSAPSKEQALASLLASLSTEASDSSSNPNDQATKEKLKSIASQLSAILGGAPATVDGKDVSTQGQVLNEDGDPIVDITEHVPNDTPSSKRRSAPPSNATRTQTSSAPRSTAATPPISAAKTSPDDAELARKKREREALFAQLEAEEEEEERRAQEAARRSHREILLEEARKKKESLANSPPLKTFLGSTSASVPKTPSPLGASNVVASAAGAHGFKLPIVERVVRANMGTAESSSPSNATPAPPTTSGTRKSVSFTPEVVAKPELPAPSLSTSMKAQPMRMEVVERVPVPKPSPSSQQPAQPEPKKKLIFKAQKVTIRQTDVDSDDEDADETPVVAPTSAPSISSDQEDEPFAFEDEDHPEVQGGVLSDSSSEDDDEEDNDSEAEWDEAMLQRELALEYMKQKGIIQEVRKTAEVPVVKNVTKDPGSWDQENVPLDATLASTKRRSNISKFKAERGSRFRNSNPLPADPFLAASIRHGKLVNGELVGDPDDEPSDEDEEDENNLGATSQRALDKSRLREYENAKKGIADLMGVTPEEVDPSYLLNMGPEYRPIQRADMKNALATPGGSTSSKESPPPNTQGTTAPVAEPAAPRVPKVSRFKAGIAASESAIPSSSRSASTVLGPSSTPTSRPAFSSSGVAERIPTSSQIQPPAGTSTPARRVAVPKAKPKLASAKIGSPSVPLSAHAGSSAILSPPSGGPSVSMMSGPSGGGMGMGFSSVILTPEEASTSRMGSRGTPSTGAGSETAKIPQARQSAPPAPAMAMSVVERASVSESRPLVGTRGGATPPGSTPTPKKISRFKAERI